MAAVPPDRQPVANPLELATALLDAIETEIVPMTRRGVMGGNKIFGAAILKKSDLSTVIAETNNETENPLWHGEMHALKKLYEQPAAGRPAPSDCIFLATHEPCSLCLSAITWDGYDNFYYLFSHQDSRDSFAIPHDIKILREVFSPPGTSEDAPLYNRDNAFWSSRSIASLIESLGEDDRAALEQRIVAIAAVYDEMSATYQGHKGEAQIPLPSRGSGGTAHSIHPVSAHSADRQRSSPAGRCPAFLRGKSPTGDDFDAAGGSGSSGQARG